MMTTRIPRWPLLALLLALGACDGGQPTSNGAEPPAAETVQTPLHPWMDTTLAPEVRAERLVSALSLEQKFQQLVGNAPEIVPELPQCLGARHVRGIAELAIPTLRITNGPVGIGQNDCVDAALFKPDMPLFLPYTHESSAKATALPSAMAIAATFDPAAAELFGQVIADEANALALHVFEAPGVNLARIPVLGRNFEYGGEDPYLTGLMAATQIRRIQEGGVIAMAKHFAANEQETNRMNIAQSIDERVLRELYLLPFEMAVRDGDVAALMCSYNDINGTQACENRWLLDTVLREEWGFKGYVQSDFFAAKSTAASMKAGLDHLMPMPLQWAPEKLQAALDSGELSEADLDRALQRRYAQEFRLGIFDRPLVQQPIDVKKGGDTARAIGTRAAVLLQNNGALPFPTTVRRIALIGKASQVYAQQAVAGGVMPGKPMGAGGGSSDVVPHYTVSPIEGIRNALAAAGNAAAEVELVLVADDNSDIDAALAAARSADAVVIMAGTIAEEGADRASFADGTAVGAVVAMGDTLDWYAERPNRVSSATHADPAQLNPPRNSQTIAMIRSIMQADTGMAAKVALVLKDNAGVSFPDDPLILGEGGPAILEVWFPGQEDGNIVADLLFGVANPSGKAPVSFPVTGRGFLDAIRDDPASYPGLAGAGKPEVSYREGLNMGYRWYDANPDGQCLVDARGRNPCLAFAFGHGLSYTSFVLSAPSARWIDGALEIEVDVSNVGARKGAEVVQVYLGIPAPGEPPKRLVGFQRVELAAGERRHISLPISPDASHHPFDVFDVASGGWVRVNGEIAVHIGTSSSPANLFRLTPTR